MSDHLTEDQMCRAIAGCAAPAEVRHLTGCPVCRSELERSGAALAAFRLAVSERAGQLATASIADRQSIRPVRRVPAAALPAGALALVLATLVYTVPASLPRQPVRRAADTRWVGGAGSSSDRALAGDEFFPLAYSHLPAASSRIVRLEVPAEALLAFGVEGGAAGGRPGVVLADVVIGDDGLARAVRFVRASESAR